MRGEGEIGPEPIDRVADVVARRLKDDAVHRLETAVAARPEVIFLQAQDAKLPERLKATPAAQAHRVYHIDDNLMLRPGPRIIEGLAQTAAEIHPQLFKPDKQ